MRKKNRTSIATNDWYFADPRTGERSHFKGSEVQSDYDHVVHIRQSTLIALIDTRADLNALPIVDEGDEVCIAVTDGLRLPVDTQIIANKYGWLDEGGLVARESQHERGCAVDIRAYFKQSGLSVPIPILLRTMKRHFDYVKGYNSYAHGDTRFRK